MLDLETSRKLPRQGMPAWTVLENDEVQQGIIHRVNREDEPLGEQNLRDDGFALLVICVFLKGFFGGFAWVSKVFSKILANF